MPRNRAKRDAKTAGAMSEDVPLFPRRRTGGEWVEVTTLPHHQQAMPRNRAKRGAKTAGAQSAAPAGAFRSATAAGGTWRGDRLFLCSPAAEQAANEYRQKPRLTPNRLCRAIAQSAMQKTAGAPSEDVPLSSPPPNRRRMVGARNPAPPLAGYAAQCKKDEASLMYKSSRTNSSPPQNAARRPIRRWNIPLCTSFVYISHKIHAQSLSYCYVGVDLLRQIAYT